MRCSALDKLFLCTGSRVPPEEELRIESEAASLGTAVHAVLAHVAENNLKTLPPLEPFLTPGVDEKELARMAWAGVNFLNEYQLTPLAIEQEFSLDSDGAVG